MGDNSASDGLQCAMIEDFEISCSSRDKRKYFFTSGTTQSLLPRITGQESHGSQTWTLSLRLNSVTQSAEKRLIVFERLIIDTTRIRRGRWTPHLRKYRGRIWYQLDRQINNFTGTKYLFVSSSWKRPFISARSWFPSSEDTSQAYHRTTFQMDRSQSQQPKWHLHDIVSLPSFKDLPRISVTVSLIGKNCIYGFFRKGQVYIAFVTDFRNSIFRQNTFPRPPSYPLGKTSVPASRYIDTRDWQSVKHLNTWDWASRNTWCMDREQLPFYASNR